MIETTNSLENKFFPPNQLEPVPADQAGTPNKNTVVILSWASVNEGQTSFHKAMPLRMYYAVGDETSP